MYNGEAQQIIEALLQKKEEMREQYEENIAEIDTVINHVRNGNVKTDSEIVKSLLSVVKKRKTLEDRIIGVLTQAKSVLSKNQIVKRLWDESPRNARDFELFTIQVSSLLSRMAKRDNPKIATNGGRVKKDYLWGLRDYFVTNDSGTFIVSIKDEYRPIEARQVLKNKEAPEVTEAS
jgi:hypothetical protein